MNYNLLFETISGSRLYGINSENSDTDLRGVCFEPLNAILGLSNFEQYQNNNIDEVIYGLRKFANLLIDGNPNIVEFVFCPTTGPTKIYCTPAWLELITYREWFFSKKRIISAFFGYATQQKKRLLTHYKWLNGEPPKNVKPEDFGGVLKTDGSNYSWPNNAAQNDYSDKHEQWIQYQTWIKNRNPKRHELEIKYNYDTKFGSHIVRLYSEAIDLLETGEIEFPLKNRNYLLDIRNGKVSFTELLQMVADLENDLKELEETSVYLPDKPNYDKANELIMKLTYDNLKRELPFYFPEWR